MTGQWQTVAFFDSAHAKLNRHPWSGGDNSATLSGAGVGLAWGGKDLWRVSISVARRIGGVPSVVSDQSSTRVWAVISKGF
ncbi:hypothetical protein [Achromobacter aloeverae]|uniref:Haemolysin activator HlyB C-terminal domain-containing protein n=1 Tax=Achromobacter aloeverae TaxID=1750518 RepID=A0A4Q1HM74_9BURK|nr:hypothetical protein [Achromobacter aloeverae]RXN91593.1 hypothetical protein C7R54_10745 [Achromobacter aloeverae]